VLHSLDGCPCAADAHECHARLFEAAPSPLREFPAAGQGCRCRADGIIACKFARVILPSSGHGSPDPHAATQQFSGSGQPGPPRPACRACEVRGGASPAPPASP
ncbi:MAG: hypothetical protein ACK559_28550, partial [bacterium]